MALKIQILYMTGFGFELSVSEFSTCAKILNCSRWADFLRIMQLGVSHKLDAWRLKIRGSNCHGVFCGLFVCNFCIV